MPLAQILLLNINPFLLGIIIIGGSIALSIVGLIIVRNLIPHHRLKLHNDVAGPIYSTLGVIYAVLLAFIAVVVWQNFDKSKLSVETEANALGDLYRDAEPFLESFKNEIRGLTREYAEKVINEEWLLLAEGRESPKVTEITKKFWKLYSNYSPRNTTEEIFLAESLRRLNQLGDLRTIRLMDSHSGINPILWAVLIIGGLSTVIFTFIFGAESFKAQMTMAVLLTILVSLILYTILLLDYPFSGGIKISAYPFKQVLSNIY